MPTINTINDLDKVLSPYIIKAMELTRDRIFEVISQKVSDYYNEPVFNNTDPTVPRYYDRTGTLMESLTGSHVTKTGNSYAFTVGWEDDYLSFRYPGGFVRKHSNGTFNELTGKQVLEAFNSSSHGFTVKGSHDYFDEAIEELGGEAGIVALFKKNCKRVGIPITN
jgi:hypothetical protein